MGVFSVTCPSCGAPAQIPFGKSSGICEFCGGQVHRNLCDSEFASMKKNQEFIDSIRASIHCIQNRDYETAIDYAEKASKLDSTDPAPMMIKYISFLGSDFRKATSFSAIAKSMMKDGGSEALTQDEYKELLAVFTYNYLYEKDKDLKRVFANMRKVRPDDIQNVGRYERMKRIEDYFTDPELKDAMITACSDYVKDCEDSMKVTGELSQSNWDELTEIRNHRLFTVSCTVFVDPGLSGRVTQYVQKYRSALNQKWEPLFKKGTVNGSKDQVNVYRYEADSILSWLRTVR
jgi:hypothetical protein